jgi:hypothetical protein
MSSAGLAEVFGKVRVEHLHARDLLLLVFDCVEKSLSIRESTEGEVGDEIESGTRRLPRQNQTAVRGWQPLVAYTETI